MNATSEKRDKNVEDEDVVVYVGIVTHNSLSDLNDCLHALSRQTRLPDQIIVLDNASADGIVHWLEANYPDVTVIANDVNEGFGRGHNGILSLFNLDHDDVYLVLNPDVILESDFIQKLLRGLCTDEYGWACGKLLLPDGRIYSVGHALCRNGYAFNIGFQCENNSTFDTSREVFGAPGAAVMYRFGCIRQILQDNDFFDPIMFMYSEDVDVDWRARRAGWRCIYVADAVGVHHFGMPESQMQVKTIVNRYLSVIKNAFLTDLLFYNIPLIILHCLFRLIVTPRLGIQIILLLARNAGNAWRKRSDFVISHDEMVGWFRWGCRQSSHQPRTYLERMQAFWRRR